MCGIFGLISHRPVDQSLIDGIGRSLRHRGPDDEGNWSDVDGRVVLGHRRLSIVDLSPHGHQPMPSGSGRLVISYNGEIYNHREIRASLEVAGLVPEGGWRGHSDTETLLAAIEAWGLERALDLAVGMFAFALWDRSTRRLWLVRDRFGEKPLFYGWAGRDFVFASELKAIRLHPGFAGEIDRRAVGTYASRAFVPAPWTIYRGLFKLLPGTILELGVDAAGTPLAAPISPDEGERGGISARRYYDYAEVVRAGQANLFDSEEDALDALDSALAGAASAQAVADVPVGAFLSGGIDSSSVVAYYQKAAPGPVHSYTIGFAEAGFDEAAHARAVAAHLGTEHHELYLSDAEAREVIPLLSSIYDEPFGDSSQIPTYLVSRFARSEVTVALSGDGGDEMFGGYNRHVLVPPMWKRIAMLPQPMRSAASKAILAVPGRLRDDLGNRLLGGRGGIGAKLDRAARLLGTARSFDQLYGGFLDEWQGEGSPVIGHRSEAYEIADVSADPAIRGAYADTMDYLPNDILCKVDRASMAVSLECRAPFLDHRVSDVASRIPTRMKISGGAGKQILRKLLYRHLPRALVDRPKAGFAVPVGQWIRGPLRDWAEALLSEQALQAHGYFDVARVRRKWKLHLHGQDSTPALWAILMFQVWLAENGQGASASGWPHGAADRAVSTGR